VGSEKTLEEKFNKYFRKHVMDCDYTEAVGGFNSIWLSASFRAGHELAKSEDKEKIEKLKKELLLINDASYKNGMFYLGEKSIFPNGWYSLKEFLALVLKEIEE